MKDVTKPPKHLKAATRRWFKAVTAEYELEEHHRRLLTLAAESWDRCTEAREALKLHGLIFEDRFGQPRSRPEVQIERDSRISFARLLRELALDVEPPAEASRPAQIQPKGGLRKCHG